MWKAHMLLPGCDQDARLVPMIVMLREGGGCCNPVTLGANTTHGDCSGQCHAEGIFVWAGGKLSKAPPVVTFRGKGGVSPARDAFRCV